MVADGLWTILFAAASEKHAGTEVSEEVNRGGTLVITRGRIYGGGISFYFVGDCAEDADGVRMRIRAVRYNDLVASPFGNDNQVDLIFTGQVTGDSMSLDGHVAKDPRLQLKIHAHRRVKIPD